MYPYQSSSLVASIVMHTEFIKTDVLIEQAALVLTP